MSNNVIASDFYEARRKVAENSLQRAYRNWQQNDYVIPNRLPRGFWHSEKALELQSAFLEAQTNLKERLALKLQLQVDTYVTGIEYQMKRLEDTHDQPAIDLLKAEIDKVKRDPTYFESLMTDK